MAEVRDTAVRRYAWYRTIRINDLCAYVDKIWPSHRGKAGLKINLGAFMFADNPDIIKISNQVD